MATWREVITPTASSSAQDNARICADCHQPAPGQYVRALGAIFHLYCFRCQDCDAVVTDKFFPIEELGGGQYVLCELDYLRRLNLAVSVRGDPHSSHSGYPVYTDNSMQAKSLTCAECWKPLTGRFVRAFDTVFHCNCFRCQDCNVVIASNFFPVDGTDGRRRPLCERDYFGRLYLMCAKCDQPLRGSYITACDKKFHVEHFTCSVCPTSFGPHDSYYEHDNNVYCHFHFATRFATKCVGCNGAILKQFVEINRNMCDECWHPECHMIYRFWNVKIAPRQPKSPLPPPAPSAESFHDSSLISSDSNTRSASMNTLCDEEDKQETAQSLWDNQVKMEHRINRIWTVLAAFEESSAACISDMLRQVSGGQYLEAIRQAEKFILHVEVLFATIDDLEASFVQHQAKGMSHVREARMLCRKTVDLFTLLSRMQDANAQSARKVGMTQELLSLVTGLAHYLKILIRIALTGALKLECEFGDSAAIDGFLDKLHRLSLEGGSPFVRRLIPGAAQDDTARGRVPRVNDGTQGVIFGYKSLAPENAGSSPFGRGDNMVARMKSPSDLCLACNITVEEDCVRLGAYMRWHSQCVKCRAPGCDRVAAPAPVKEPKQVAPAQGDDEDSVATQTKNTLSRRLPAAVGEFLFEPEGWSGEGSPPLTNTAAKVTAIFCLSHGHAKCNSGFQAVSRLEQYAFLLNVALRRLYLLLKRRGVMPASPVVEQDDHRLPTSSYDSHRDSADIMRFKTSAHLDRKLSSTARLPKRSTIVESPAGKVAHQSDVNVAMGSKQSIPSSDSTSTLNVQTSQQMLRPSFARNNTRVVIMNGGPESPRPMEPEDIQVISPALSIRPNAPDVGVPEFGIIPSPKEPFPILGSSPIPPRPVTISKLNQVSSHGHAVISSINGQSLPSNAAGTASSPWSATIAESIALFDGGINLTSRPRGGSPPTADNEHPLEVSGEVDDNAGPMLQRRFSLMSFESVTVFDGEDPTHMAAKEAYYCDDDTASISTFNSHLL